MPEQGAPAMEPNINDLKRYAGLSPDDDPLILELCMRSAEEWFANAGVKEAARCGSLYCIGVYMLATHYYDQRGVLDVSSAAKGSAELPFGVMSIMHQLRL